MAADACLMGCNLDLMGIGSSIRMIRSFSWDLKLS